MCSILYIISYTITIFIYIISSYYLYTILIFTLLYTLYYTIIPCDVTLASIGFYLTLVEERPDHASTLVVSVGRMALFLC